METNTGIKNYLNYVKTESKSPKRFVITGTNVNGRHFKPIHTNNPQHYNIFRGSVWVIQPNGKRKLAYRIYN